RSTPHEREGRAVGRPERGVEGAAGDPAKVRAVGPGLEDVGVSPDQDRVLARPGRIAGGQRRLGDALGVGDHDLVDGRVDQLRSAWLPGLERGAWGAELGALAAGKVEDDKV